MLTSAVATMSSSQNPKTAGRKSNSCLLVPEEFHVGDVYPSWQTPDKNHPFHYKLCKARLKQHIIG